VYKFFLSGVFEIALERAGPESSKRTVFRGRDILKNSHSSQDAYELDRLRMFPRLDLSALENIRVLSYTHRKGIQADGTNAQRS
jgi:hypothetical protein